MDIDLFMKIQNAYGTNNRREKELAKINLKMQRHFNDTYDTEEVLINGVPKSLMIIKDTDGNTFKKKIKSCHDDKFNLGDYILWNNQYWLITLLDPDEKTWNRGYMYLCTVPLRWQNSNQEIITRWAYSEDFTKYSSGVTGNNTIQIGDNQYGLTLPIDEETKNLVRDMRFSVDFDDADKPDIYKLTNRKVILNNNQYFGRGGIMTLTLSYDAFNPNTDKMVKIDDDKRVWICDYHSPTLTPDDLDYAASIQGNKNMGIGISKVYSVKFTDSAGASIDPPRFEWNIISDFFVQQDINDDTIELLVEDEELLANSFLLQVLVGKDVVAEDKITITGGY